MSLLTEEEQRHLHAVCRLELFWPSDCSRGCYILFENRGVGEGGCETTEWRIKLCRNGLKVLLSQGWCKHLEGGRGGWNFVFWCDYDQQTSAAFCQSLRFSWRRKGRSVRELLLIPARKKQETFRVRVCLCVIWNIGRWDVYLNNLLTW